MGVAMQAGAWHGTGHQRGVWQVACASNTRACVFVCAAQEEAACLRCDDVHLRECRLPPAAFGRQKASKVKLCRGQSARRQCCDCSACAWDGHDSHACLNCSCHEAGPGV